MFGILTWKQVVPAALFSFLLNHWSKQKSYVIFYISFQNVIWILFFLSSPLFAFGICDSVNHIFIVSLTLICAVLTYTIWTQGDCREPIKFIFLPKMGLLGSQAGYEKKLLVVNYEKLLRAVLSCFHGQIFFFKFLFTL